MLTEDVRYQIEGYREQTLDLEGLLVEIRRVLGNISISKLLELLDQYDAEQA